ncbi:MAG TPA: dinitrogenase iron-molybdenum cofactor biosynthesis protein [Dehalococcoidia bacterium]|jgi:predicted Fe-Mo cluster-binding NifX family protein|nr:dinitrogenase iron-molybdenum cofactor biosynthesis protein [Dehalococcoidia bacterium]
MKIAAISDDETTISQHFGRAPLYVVVSVEDGKIISKETRAKTGHHTFAAHQPSDLAPGERHGYDAGSQIRHQSMAETISDCQVLLAGGMGWGAYESMQSYNIEPIVTDVNSIDEAVQLYLDDKLTNLMERLH